MRKLAFTLATGILISGAANLNAAPILNISSEGLVASQAAETAFLGTLAAGFLTETFDAGYIVGSQSLTINSVAGVGSFTMNTAGSGGDCDASGYSCAAGLAVLDTPNSPFSGRFDVSPDNWLDSMDAQKMTISPVAGFTAMGFYMTDPNDAGGRFSIGGVDFSFADIFGASLGSGEVYYLTIYDSEGLGDLSIHANDASDGFGLDNVTVGKVPEPGTLALFGLGLLGLGVARKRRNS